MPNPQFNELLTRAIAALYRNHPSPQNLASDDLWNPPIKSADADYDKKTTVSGGTLTWLFRNGFVGGEFREFQSGSSAIFKAQLTAHGYRVASALQTNYGNMPLGQVAIKAATD